MEKFRRDKGNENDGGLLRHVYEGGPFPRERGRIVAFESTKDYTYAAADITKGYSPGKAREVTRQFLYLRGPKEFFVVFDRVESARPDLRRHFFLHIPEEPEVAGNRSCWASLPLGDGDAEVLSKGRSRVFLHTLLPPGAEIVKRGGPGEDAWGHPLEPSAQYNHEAPGRKKPPICPFRLEVGDPGSGARTLFLHVFEIAEEDARVSVEVRLVEPAGVDIGGVWKVRFRAEGPVGGTVGNADLSASVKTEQQYR